MPDAYTPLAAHATPPAGTDATTWMYPILAMLAKRTPAPGTQAATAPNLAGPSGNANAGGPASSAANDAIKTAIQPQMNNIFGKMGQKGDQGNAGGNGLMVSPMGATPPTTPMVDPSGGGGLGGAGGFSPPTSMIPSLAPMMGGGGAAGAAGGGGGGILSLIMSLLGG